MTLLDITNQESGIVIFPGSPIQMIICNWRSTEGVPRVAIPGLAILGLGEKLIEVDRESIWDIGKYLEQYNAIDLVYDANRDINNLHGLSGSLYYIVVFDSEMSFQVIAPKGWN